MKQYFGNFLTGKLSDFAGLFIFPLFFAGILRRRQLLIYIVVAILFIFWKSPFSDEPIKLWNSFGFFIVGRTVDFSDLSALIVLPFSYFYLHVLTTRTVKSNILRQIGTAAVIVVAVFAFTATTLVKDRNLFMEGSYFVKESRTEILTSLNQNPNISNVKSQRDDEVFNSNEYPNVKTDGKTYFVDFDIDQKICDTNVPTFSVVLIEEKSFTELRGPSVQFECKLYESNVNPEQFDASYKQEAHDIFTREVVTRLTQYKSR